MFEAATQRLLTIGVLAAMLAVPMVAEAPIADAMYASGASGSARARAATLPIPPPPTVTSSGVVGITCVVQLSWTAPPAGEQYTITRTIGTNTVVVAGPTTTSGTATDTVLLSQLLGPASYRTKANWTTAPAWTATSSAATLTGC